MKVVRVVLDVPLDTHFDYLAPEVAGDLIGLRVLAPFGPRQMVGVIVAEAERSELEPGRLKPLVRILRDIPPLPHEVLELCKFCRRYYHHPFGAIVLNALPTALRRTAGFKQRTVSSFVLTDAGRELDPAQVPTRAVTKHRLLNALQQNGKASGTELAAISPGYRKTLREFIALGWVEERREPEQPQLASLPASPQPQLNEEQRHAVEAVQNQLTGFNVWLLHGITGSGKTEVYLHLIARFIQEGRQVLVLVPEINLTPQLEATFRGRFPQSTLVNLHSGLGETERAQNWLLAQSGAAQIVLGTRLAVFTPLPRLGLVIVDEEHDSSFKQQEGLRYSARDVAVARARQLDIPVLLGSATPSLESWHNAQSGRYRLLQLSRRAAMSAALPTVRCIDMRREKPLEGLSKSLITALGERLQKGEQSLVFINRRGYAPVLTCGECGWLSPCPRCSARLVVHLRERRLRCHHCGHQEIIPVACPDCGNADLKALGQGTQRVEMTLAQLFPTARILRIDRDSTRRKGAWQEAMQQVHADQVDILVGTQILAKGHDFPKITLVGILNADGALYSTDFRASERLFAQLMQVSGRAGRAAIAGEVLVQTEFPEHILYHSLVQHDYAAFAESELLQRQRAGFPPFTHQALLRAEAPKLDTALGFLVTARNLALSIGNGVTLYDPVPAQMMRHSGNERAQLLVQSDSRKVLQAFLGAWMALLTASQTRNVRWSLDVDPLEF
jgi:primosomal protein N' (replication factor Y)